MPGPLGGAALTAEEWLVVGLLGAAVLALVVVLLLPVGPLRNDLNGLPDKDDVGILIALVGGCVAGLGLGQWWDFRPGGPGWKHRPPRVRPDAPKGIELSPSFEVYDPHASDRRRGP